MTATQTEILRSVLRWLISMAAGGLVVRHVISAGQAESLTADLTTHILLAVPVVAPIVWSIAEKLIRRAREALLEADSYIVR